MNSKLVNLFALMLVAGSFCVMAEEPKPAPVKGSAEFEKMKTLVGKWSGKVDMGQGPVEMVAEYRVIAGGSVIEERVFPGSPMEMVSMYYDKGGKLAMTHYCMLGNRPQMNLKSSDATSITLDFDEACGIDAKKECHMHGSKIVFVDADTVTTSCSALKDGKEMPQCATTLKRIK
jgi:hypothetical protein